MASSEGVSTNTVLLVGVALVFIYMQQRRSDAQRELSIARARAQREGRAFGLTRAERELVEKAAVGLGSLLGEFLKGDEDEELLSSGDPGYSGDASPGDPDFVGPLPLEESTEEAFGDFSFGDESEGLA